MEIASRLSFASGPRVTAAQASLPTDFADHP
jgi:hypothetical protein